MCVVARYGKLMKVTGRPKLIRLAQGAAADLCAAVRAFHAELEEARWHSHRDPLSVYPRAHVEAHRLVVPLDERHCVVVGINYESGIALIEYAGANADRRRKSPNFGRVQK